MPQTALPDPVRNPEQLLIGWLHLARQLVGDLGVTLRFAPMPGRELGDFDPLTCTLYMREDASIENQIWLLQQCWNALAIGPHASRSARRTPLLHTVPAPRDAPREASDEQTA